MPPRMSLDAAARHDALNAGFQRYRDTTITGGSYAHLGDNNVTQNVIVNGNINMHFPSSLKFIAAANHVVEFLDIITDLQRLGRGIEKENQGIASERSNRDATLRDSGPQLQSQVYLDTGLTQSEIAVLKRDQNTATAKAMIQRLSEAVSRMKFLSHSQNTPSTLAPERHLLEYIKIATDDAQAILDVLISIQQKSERETDLNAARDSLLENMQQAWKNESLVSKRMSHEQYRKGLNHHLAALLNVQPSLQDLFGEQTHRRGPHEQEVGDIIEILSVIRPDPSGMLTDTAVLTQRDGQTVTITPSMSLSHVSIAPSVQRLIKYDLCSRDPTDPQSTTIPAALVQDAANYTQLVIGALYFREESARRIEVHEAHRQTFDWIFKSGSDATDDKFSSWLTNTKDCFWIEGKAGSGKSTLMKYIYHHASLKNLLKHWAGSKELLICSFFFWHAGTPLQNSREGVLRAILHQVLTARPHLVPVVFPHLTRYLLLRKTHEHLHISIAELKEALSALIACMPEDLAIFLLIDGIDEYKEDHYDFARFLVHLARCPSIKLLASSRPISACYQIFSQFPRLRLQDLTMQDIRAYIDDELVHDDLFQDMNTLEEGFAEEIITALTEKASGVFLWIVLVVRRLLVGLGNYDDKHILMKSIDELPNDLEDLYDFMFGKMSERYQKEGSRYLQILSHAHETQSTPLTAAQLYIIDKHFDGTSRITLETSRTGGKGRLWSKWIEGKLRSRCCGLIEVQYISARGLLEEPKVDFLHRTVYDYVRDPSVRTKLLDLYDYDRLIMSTHLLIGSTYRLKHEKDPNTKTIPLSPDDRSDNWKYVIADFLIHSVHLSNANDETYLPYLESAHDAFYTFYDKPSLCWAVYNIANAKLRIPRGFEALENISFVHVTWLLISTRLGLSAYLERQLHTQKISLGVRSLLLLESFGALHMSGSVAAISASYLRIVNLLLFAGADLNFPARYSPAYQESSLFDTAASIKDIKSRTLPQSEAIDSPLTPWDFWLHFSPPLEHPFMEVTLKLFQTQPKPEPSTVSRRKAILELHKKLEKGQRDSTVDTRTRQLIDDVLEIIHRYHKPLPTQDCSQVEVDSATRAPLLKSPRMSSLTTSEASPLASKSPSKVPSSITEAARHSKKRRKSNRMSGQA